jgi:membrane protease YdiL (CAAX protease family)
VIQGAAEEFLCRGLVFHAMKAKTSIPIAMAVSTLVFIWPHWGSLSEAEPVFIVLGLLNLTLISVIFCLLTLRFNSIWAACGLHSLWNAILSCVLGLNLSGNEENVAAVFSLQTVGETVWNGGAYGIEASLITALVFGVAALLLLPKKN